MPKKWDGRGKPPSREAVIDWFMEEAGVTRDQAIRAIPKTGTLTATGHAARELASKLRDFEVGGDTQLPNLSSLRLNVPDFVSGGKAPVGSGGRGNKRAGLGASSRRQGPTRTDNPDDAPLVDTNGNGSVADEAQAGGTDANFDGIPDMPMGAESTRGAPLWPYQGSAESLEAIEVTDNDPMAGYGRRHRRDVGPEGVKIGARYYEQDTLEPLKWSAEQRADLQRVLHGIGLYGDKKVRLGSWTADDQAIYAELLSNANVEGLTWAEQLVRWKRQPPEDLLQAIEGAGGGGMKRPPIVVTNPLDIQQTAQAVSQSLTGEVDRGFAESTVAPYQGLEAGAQNADYAASMDGSGGTVTQAPSVSAFIDDKLRREQPIEVDGYQFLTQFQQFMSMLGVQ